MYGIFAFFYAKQHIYDMEHYVFNLINQTFYFYERFSL